MPSLKDLELHLPQLPSEEDWMEVINDLTGFEKEATIVRAKGYNLLADFYEEKATEDVGRR